MSFGSCEDKAGRALRSVEWGRMLQHGLVPDKLTVWFEGLLHAIGMRSRQGIASCVF